MKSDQDAALRRFNVDDLIMSATAYYLGRTSAMVESHCDRQAWQKVRNLWSEQPADA